MLCEAKLQMQISQGEDADCRCIESSTYSSITGAKGSILSEIFLISVISLLTRLNRLHNILAFFVGNSLPTPQTFHPKRKGLEFNCILQFFCVFFEFLQSNGDSALPTINKIFVFLYRRTKDSTSFEGLNLSRISSFSL